MLVVAGGLVWYRADRVFDREFEPDGSRDDEARDADSGPLRDRFETD